MVLDDVIWKGFAGHDEKGRIVRNHYRGGLRDDQLRFVENYVATVPADALVVLAMHIPLAGKGRSGVEERRRLFEILSTHPHTFSISGHSHRQRWFFFGAEDGYAPPGGGEHVHLNAVTASGSWYAGADDEVGLPHTTMRDGAPNGYSIVSFDGPRYSVRYKASRWPADHQMRIFAPDRVARGDAAETAVFVNVFAGSERSEVEMRLAPSGSFAPMERVEVEDPLYARAREREGEKPAWKRLPKPAPSTHLWRAPRPAEPEPGAHWIEVRATDLFGRTHRGRQPLRVE